MNVNLITRLRNVFTDELFHVGFLHNAYENGYDAAQQEVMKGDCEDDDEDDDDLYEEHVEEREALRSAYQKGTL